MEIVRNALAHVRDSLNISLCAMGVANPAADGAQRFFGGKDSMKTVTPADNCKS